MLGVKGLSAWRSLEEQLCCVMMRMRDNVCNTHTLSISRVRCLVQLQIVVIVTPHRQLSMSVQNVQAMVRTLGGGGELNMGLTHTDFHSISFRERIRSCLVLQDMTLYHVCGKGEGERGGTGLDIILDYVWTYWVFTYFYILV